jgi:hypothetical protein
MDASLLIVILLLVIIAGIGGVYYKKHYHGRKPVVVAPTPVYVSTYPDYWWNTPRWNWGYAPRAGMRRGSHRRRR